jgi:hypothetical protein
LISCATPATRLPSEASSSTPELCLGSAPFSKRSVPCKEAHTTVLRVPLKNESSSEDETRRKPRCSSANRAPPATTRDRPA